MIPSSQTLTDGARKTAIILDDVAERIRFILGKHKVPRREIERLVGLMEGGLSQWRAEMIEALDKT